MPYFEEIAEYSTYSGHDADFHFIYNSNSGGGQAFLAGRFYDESGQLVSPESLDGKTALFRYVFRSQSGEDRCIILNDDKAKYEVKPRGNGSTSMKLGVGTGRVSPSKVMSSFMMLPPTCGVKMPNNLQWSILSANNFWLQSMWLECCPNADNPNEVLFTVKDCVFCGGESKDSTDRTGRYFKLNFDKRIADIIELSNHLDAFDERIAAIIGQFADTYLGRRAFQYEECSEATKSLMMLLPQEYPESYSGIMDPLPILQEVMIMHENRMADGERDLESAFKEWLSCVTKANGELYSENTRNQYISALKAVGASFAGAIAPCTSIFEIRDTDSFSRVYDSIKASEGYEAFNQARGNGALSAGLELYNRFLREHPITVESCPVNFKTGLVSDQPHNRILFGAPGTGKSFTLNCDKDALLAAGGEYERVTFHPDYSYANFVGTYKPVPCKDSDGKDAITYAYVPGPFMRTYVKALQNSRTAEPKPFLLIIEEINRANVAAVFGDVFQLLDRGEDEVSEYPIQASEDIKKHLAEKLGGAPDDYSEIRIPDNMFIWATMNSADQGVFPMDTAFKRRWDFTYLGIDDSEAGIAGRKVILGQGEYRRIVEWNALRKAINSELLTYKVNEDKLMGPYFISKKSLPDGDTIDAETFARIFKNKVIMYLFDDAAKQKRLSLFGGFDEKSRNQYSKICREFDTKGVYIFCDGISSQFIDGVPEDEGV